MSKITTIINEMMTIAQEAVSVNQKQKAVIFDLDGTLMDHRHRLHYMEAKQWDEYHQAVSLDEPITPMIDELKQCIRDGSVVLIWSGRSIKTRETTMKMLVEQDIVYVELKMRPENDHRPATDIKREWYQTLLIEDKYDVVGAWDDTDAILELWQSYNIPTTKVHFHY